MKKRLKKKIVKVYYFLGEYGKTTKDLEIEVVTKQGVQTNKGFYTLDRFLKEEALIDVIKVKHATKQYNSFIKKLNKITHNAITINYIALKEELSNLFEIKEEG